MTTTPSGAKFKINTSPSSDAGYDALESTTLDLQLEASPATDVGTCVYSVLLATSGAPTPTLTNSGVASPPTSVVQITLGAGVHSYAIMCRTNNGDPIIGADGRTDYSVNTFVRVISVRNTAGLRKMLVGERLEYDPAEGWTAAFNEMIDAIAGAGPSPYASTPEAIEFGAGSAGVSTDFAKGDHSHPMAFPAVVTEVSWVGGLGTSATPAREDHQHEITFTTVNFVLGTASAPIDVNGQTLTSGGFIAPYFSTNAANPASAGLVRAAKNTVALSFRNDTNSSDMDAVSMVATNVLKVGSNGVAELRSVVKPAGSFTLYDDTSLFATWTLAGGLLLANSAAASTETASGVRVQAYGDALRAHNYALSVLAPDVENAAGSEDLRNRDQRSARVTTNGATTTTALSFTIPDNCVALIEMRTICWTSDGGTSAVYKRAAGYKRFNPGGATLIGSIDTIIEEEDNAALDATLDTDGANDVRVRVTGLGATIFQWFVTMEVTLMKPA